MLHSSVMEQVQKGNGDAPIFIRHSDGRAFTACHILDAAVRNGLNLFTGVPEDGTKISRQAVIQFAKGIFHVQTTEGSRDLGKLIIGVDVHAKKCSSPLPEKGFCYGGTGPPSTYGVETETELLGKQILVSFHKQVGSDVLTVTITKKK